MLEAADSAVEKTFECMMGAIVSVYGPGAAITANHIASVNAAPA